MTTSDKADEKEEGGHAHERESILSDLADLFGEVEDMGELDASEFVDNAGKIWDLRERARKLLHR